MNFNQLSTETIIYFIILTRICILLFAFKILGWKAVSPFYFKSLKYISSDSHDHAQCRKNLARFILLTVKSPHYSQLKQRVFNSNSKYFEEHLKPHDITFRFGPLSTPNATKIWENSRFSREIIPRTNYNLLICLESHPRGVSLPAASKTCCLGESRSTLLQWISQILTTGKINSICGRRSWIRKNLMAK